MKETAQVHLYISGIVQGVCFRAYTQETAQGLGLTGWVRNLHDGRVEVIADGPKDKIQELIEWCHKGPPGAAVDNVEINWENTTGEFPNFETR